MRIPAALACLFIFCVSSWADDAPSEYDSYWPQWRGPEATGVAPHADPPVEWSEDKNVRWKTEIPGAGHASPVVWGEKVFVLSAIETDRGEEQKKEQSSGRHSWMKMKTSKKVHEFAVLALDRKSGKILWKQVACEAVPHEGTHGDGSWASNSPVTDGERVYAHFGSRGLYCYDMEGKKLWDKDLGEMRTKMSFGEGSSPVIHNDTIAVIWDHEGDSFITALDKKTGKERWKAEREEDTSWATPLVVEYKGKPQVITSATHRVRSYDLATGKVIWECGGMTGNVIPCPVHRDGTVYVMSGFRGSALLAIRLANASGDVTDSDAVVWQHDKDTPYVPSPLLYGDMLYFLQVSNGVLSCFDAESGKAHYTRQKLDDVKGVYASPVGAKGRVYLTGRNGVVKVIRLSPAYEELSANVLEDEFSASPAIVDKELYLRGHKYLYCIAQN